MLTPARAELLLGLPVTQQRWQTVITMTPEKAKIILDAQPQQRPINRVTLAEITSDIANGRWRRTHQGIAFDEDGLLSDGQHRLRGCFEAGFPIEVLASFNEPRELFTTYDVGTRRGMKTHLFLAGLVKDPIIAGSVAPALTFIWAYDRGFNPTYARARDGWNFDIARATLAAHPAVVGMVETLGRKRHAAFPRGETAALFTLMHEADPAKAAIFIHQSMSGENIKAGDPAYALRENAGRPKARNEMSYRIARAWNAFYEGRSLLKIYGAKSASGPKARTTDVFPEIAGYRRPASQVAA